MELPEQVTKVAIVCVYGVIDGKWKFRRSRADLPNNPLPLSTQTRLNRREFVILPRDDRNSAASSAS